ncbi:MAG: cellulase family glycosylhydrolase [Cyclobacteriaceae bacterium]|nr:cellulase family glycosylhydrolase [Cyclobacteriaceae bacterium]
MNERLGRGVNMGNSFEAPSETEWGNQWKAEYFKIMAELGFSHVRLPVRWEPESRSMATPPYTINPAFLDRISEVVDAALANKLHIIVNMHHHEALYDNPAGQKERFLSQWEQIASHFQHYPDSLLFEVLNEPHGNISPQIWNIYFADALAKIRETNPTRCVLMGVAEFGGLGGIPYLEIPDDEYLILSPHYYNPFQFTHQGADWVEYSDPWLGTPWHDTEADRETVKSEFKFALQFSSDNHIPIHVGEFGAYSKADIESRERWTTFLARYFETVGLSWAYWEFSAGYGIYDPVSKTLLKPLVDALLNNEMPQPTPVYATTIYSSNFAAGTDGWSLSTHNGTSGSLTSSGGLLNVAITNGGTENWHVQLIRNNIPLVKNNMYQISFKARAASSRSMTAYAGKASAPWKAYSTYTGMGIGMDMERYSYIFTMNDESDPNARLVFDIGQSDADVTIADIKVEHISLESPITALQEPEMIPKTSFYPNPVISNVHIESVHHFRYIAIFDLKGREVGRFAVNSNHAEINMQNLPGGIYVVKLSGNGYEERFKVVKA